ncbi:MAG: hypothetical protein MZV70_30220 [Desulfobacterales bacterium]|nr:hypothetical protein [Desulfobacterales bacterium]
MGNSARHFMGRDREATMETLSYTVEFVLLDNHMGGGPPGVCWSLVSQLPG